MKDSVFDVKSHAIIAGNNFNVDWQLGTKQTIWYVPETKKNYNFKSVSYHTGHDITSLLLQGTWGISKITTRWGPLRSTG